MSATARPRFFESQAKLREWLERNHDREEELWVGFRKKHTKEAGIVYREALDEALCFGWIDGVRKRIDDESYQMRFTPRRANSVWSAVNIRRGHELSAQGQMRPSGLAAFEARNERNAKRYSYERNNPTFDAKSELSFRANSEAWEFFAAQPASYRRLRTWWVMSAKSAATRARRLEALIEMSAHGLRLDPMKSPFKQVEALSGGGS